MAHSLILNSSSPLPRSIPRLPRGEHILGAVANADVVAQRRLALANSKATYQYSKGQKIYYSFILPLKQFFARLSAEQRTNLDLYKRHEELCYQVEVVKKAFQEYLTADKAVKEAPDVMRARQVEDIKAKDLVSLYQHLIGSADSHAAHVTDLTQCPMDTIRENIRKSVHDTLGQDKDPFLKTISGLRARLAVQPEVPETLQGKYVSFIANFDEFIHSLFVQSGDRANRDTITEGVFSGLACVPGMIEMMPEYTEELYLELGNLQDQLPSNYFLEMRETFIREINRLIQGDQPIKLSEIKYKGISLGSFVSAEALEEIRSDLKKLRQLERDQKASEAECKIKADFFASRQHVLTAEFVYSAQDLIDFKKALSKSDLTKLVQNEDHFKVFKQAQDLRDKIVDLKQQSSEAIFVERAKIHEKMKRLIEKQGALELYIAETNTLKAGLEAQLRQYDRILSKFDETLRDLPSKVDPDVREICAGPIEEAVRKGRAKQEESIRVYIAEQARLIKEAEARIQETREQLEQLQKDIYANEEEVFQWEDEGSPEVRSDLQQAKAEFAQFKVKMSAKQLIKMSIDLRLKHPDGVLMGQDLCDVQEAEEAKQHFELSTKALKNRQETIESYRDAIKRNNMFIYQDGNLSFNPAHLDVAEEALKGALKKQIEAAVSFNKRVFSAIQHHIMTGRRLTEQETKTILNRAERGTFERRGSSVESLDQPAAPLVSAFPETPPVVRHQKKVTFDSKSTQDAPAREVVNLDIL